ncbi:MAG: BrnT family toxin [Holophaga sp.]
MIFHWDDENLAHIARHDVSPPQAEAAFQAIDAEFRRDAKRLNRWVLEATVAGRTIKVAFARVFPQGYRVITAHWMSSKRRRQP